MVSEYIKEQEKVEFEKTNHVEFLRANVTSLCKFYSLEPAPFSRVVLRNALKVFRLLA
jgi:hypothetical protein